MKRRTSTAGTVHRPRRARSRGAALLAAIVAVTLLQGTELAVAAPKLPPPVVDLVDPVPGADAESSGLPAVAVTPKDQTSAEQLTSQSADVVLDGPAPGGTSATPSPPASPSSSAPADPPTSESKPTPSDPSSGVSDPAPSEDSGSAAPPSDPATPSPTPDNPAPASPNPPVAVGDSGVSVAAADTTGSGEQLTVTVQSAPDAPAAAGEVPIVELTPEDGTTPAVEVTVADETLAGEFGADYASRVQWKAYPADAVGDESQQIATTQTKTSETTLVQVPETTGAVTLVAAATSSGTSGAGDFSATSLQPSATYKVAEQTGAFTWTYPISGTAPAYGSAPELALSYNTARIDGQTSSTNNQSSAIGNGWELDGAGFIERQYVPCSTDPAGAQQTGDLCWQVDNATMQLGGHSGQLVRDSATGVWRLQSDDGTKIEKLTGASNGDNDGEHWVITTTDGTRYYFGLDKLPGYSTGKPTTQSAWTVPVYGNQPGEPCYASTFATSSCAQAWRWNLDYVVDVHGNSQAFYYAAETNKYASNLTNSNATDYTRGGQLVRIDYGMRAGEELSTPAPYRITFDLADRCKPGSACTSATPADWPDVPWDQNCTTAPCTEKYTPTFWSTKRYAAIRSQYHTSGGSYANVDTWALSQSYPDPGDTTSAALWLQSITQTGHTNGDITLPPVTFNGVALQNRVWVTDGTAPLVKYRIANITTETGAIIAIAYSDKQCTPSNLPASAETNTMRCSPQWWTPPIGAAKLDYFHKYVITQVTANPGWGNAIQNTQYEYTGTPAWTYNDNPLTPADKRTWSSYAGYDKVRVLVGNTGTPESVQRTDYTFYQGIHGDRATPTGGTKTKTTTTSDGTTTNDEKWLAGQTAESAAYNGTTGPLLAASTYTYWSSSPTANDGTMTARRVLPDSQTIKTTIDEQSPRTTKSSVTYDSLGQPAEVEDLGDLATADDDKCTRKTYVGNPAVGLAGFTAQSTTTAEPCSVPFSETDVVAGSRTYYDGAATTSATPSRGLPTRVETADRDANGVLHYDLALTTTYDAYGRSTSNTDAIGRTQTTAFTQSPTGQLTQAVATNPAGWEATTLFAPSRGVPTSHVDASGRVTTAEYDALGRTGKVWLPGRDEGTHPTPSIAYAYTIATGQPPSVKTTSLTPSGGTVDSYEIYDALLAPRQTQSASEGGGRIITETITDAAGRAVRTISPYYALNDPSGALFVPGTVVPAETVSTYDGAGRPVNEKQVINNAAAWETTYSYDGQSVTVTPPAGGSATREFTNAQGQKTASWAYHGGTPVGSYDETTYTYSVRGQLASTTDPMGNQWTWTYDMGGNQTTATDPDAGTSLYDYDDVDRLTQLTDSRGQVISTTYDDLDRVTGTYAGAPDTGQKLTSFTFDTATNGKGRPATQTRHDATGDYVQSVNGYTAAGLPISTSVTIPSSTVSGALAKTYTTSYTYAVNDQVSAITYPAAGGLPGEKVTTSYTNLGNPSGLFRGAYAYVDSVIYTHLNETAQIAQSALNTAQYRSFYYQDGTRRLDRTLVTSWNATLADRNYTYTDSGNITAIKDNADTVVGGTDAQCFTYDYAQRLTEAWTPAAADCAVAPSAASLGGPAPYWNSYTYDPAGNRTSTTSHTTSGDNTTTYTYPSAGTAQPHALASTTTGLHTNTYQYDAAGNTTATTINGVTRTYNVGPDGQVASIQTGSTTTQQNIYDTNGQLLLRVESGETTVHLGNTQATLHADGKLSANRTIALGDQPVAVRANTPGSTASTITWLDTDHHGTATATQDPASGHITKRYYDPFGLTRGAPAPAWPTDNALLDEPQSADTGHSRFGIRDYDPTTGRFTSRDPIINANDTQQLNGYNYANNNPILLQDPTGTFPRGLFMGVGAFVKPTPGRGAPMRRATATTTNSNRGKGTLGSAPSGKSRSGARMVPIGVGSEGDRWKAASQVVVDVWSLEVSIDTAVKAANDTYSFLIAQVSINIDGALDLLTMICGPAKALCKRVGQAVAGGSVEDLEKLRSQWVGFETEAIVAEMIQSEGKVYIQPKNGKNGSTKGGRFYDASQEADAGTGTVVVEIKYGPAAYKSSQAKIDASNLANGENATTTKGAPKPIAGMVYVFVQNAQTSAGGPTDSQKKFLTDNGIAYVCVPMSMCSGSSAA